MQPNVIKRIRFQLLGAWTFLSLCTTALAVTAVSEVSGLVPFPSGLRAAREAHPVLFNLHMVGSVLAVAAIGSAIATRHILSWHRVVGHCATVFVLVAGLTAIPVAIAGASTWLAKAGFIVQATCWVIFACRGIVFARMGNRRRHAETMHLAVAVTLGAVVARILLRIPDPWLGPDQHYAIAAWLSWLLPVGTALWARRTDRFSVQSLERT